MVSAYSNVTNWLLEHKKTGEPGVYALFVENKDYQKALDELLGKLLEINQTFKDIKLDFDTAERFITHRINQSK